MVTQMPLRQHARTSEYAARHFMLFVVICGASPTGALAQTIVEGGVIQKDTTWSLGDSPFIVTAPLRIGVGATLTVEPGAEVRFRAHGQIVVDGGLWISGDLGLSTMFGSPLPGQIWTPLAVLNNDAVSDIVDDQHAKLIRAANGTVIATWNARSDTNSIYRGMHARSIDDGKSWSGPNILFDENAPPDVATDGRGNWIAVWMSYEDLGGTLGTDADVVFSASVDDGITWSQPAPVDNSADVDHFFNNPADSGANVASDGNGSWLVVWNGRKPCIGRTPKQ